MRKCPRCFNSLPEDEFAWFRRDAPEPGADQVASSYVGHEVQGPKIHTGAPEQGASDVVPVCPSCHFELWPDLYSSRVTTIAVAGARATGKTVYIAVMVKALQSFLDRIGRAVVPANAATETRYRDIYETPLYVERGVVQPTPSAALAGSYQHEPLIFSLGPGADGYTHYLAIRDVAGEDLENPSTVGREWEFFGLADTVLFLFDPLRVQEIRDQLQDLVPAADILGGDPRSVLQTVMRLIGQGAPRLGIVLSKFDALQALHGHASSWGVIMDNPGAAFNRDPMLSSFYYNDEDGELLHEEMYSMLARLHAGALVLGAQNANGRSFEHRFFAVSALGETPEGASLHENGIAPFRVLDPVLWAFGQEGA